MLEVGWWGSLRDLSKNILKQGWVKAKVVHRGKGVLKMSPPLPPRNLNRTPCAGATTGMTVLAYGMRVAYLWLGNLNYHICYRFC